MLLEHPSAHGDELAVDLRLRSVDDLEPRRSPQALVVGTGILDEDVDIARSRRLEHGDLLAECDGLAVEVAGPADAQPPDSYIAPITFDVVAPMV